jgi:hypothetical protein
MKRQSGAGLSIEQQQLVNKARILASGSLPVYLDDNELLRLVAVIHRDVGHASPITAEVDFPADAPSYYDLPLSWFRKPASGFPDFYGEFIQSSQKVLDFATYFKCLCSIHKRRVKYERIIAAQPLPTMLQVAPRALLEFGIMAAPALASWLTWRKWFYDIDNRSAQETGYLFEPILANALAGESYGASKSPIRRRSDTTKGRQVDCIVADTRTAYEFKLRVTIAASGQGRFGEELDFAADCRASGYVPILLVLDPTPSHRLTDLTREFQRAGGRAYIGDEAWLHLENQAGPTMATFVEKYVRKPISNIDRYADELMDLSVSAEEDKAAFRISLSKRDRRFEWTIARHEDAALATDDADDLFAVQT